MLQALDVLNGQHDHCEELPHWLDWLGSQHEFVHVETRSVAPAASFKPTERRGPHHRAHSGGWMNVRAEAGGPLKTVSDRSQFMPNQPLIDRVAVVAGATRGAGRGIARMLGAAGATVYCTGRSVQGLPATLGRPETIEETAEMVTAEGGRGIALRSDHTVEAEVEQLFARVRIEQGRLDILVNDIWGGDTLTEWGSPFWALSTARGFELLERAVHSHIITSRHGVPLMIERDAGLIVEVTDGDTLGYRGNFFYDIAKNAVIRLAYAMAADLRAHHVTALAITPGFLRSEAVLDTLGVTEANWRDGIEQDPYFAGSETPCFVGRAVAALAADPDVKLKSGGVYSSWGLARVYGFTDLDGRKPDWGRFFLRKVQEIIKRGTPPDDMDRFVVRSRLYQADLDPSAAEEAARIRAWLDCHK